MPSNNKHNAGEWLAKAEEDLLSIRAILKEGSPSTACFLSQQMAEKCLKGLLVFIGKPFPWVHDLLELESILLDPKKQESPVHRELALLNRFYIETRYPGDYPQFTQDDAREAFRVAITIRDFVAGIIEKQTKLRE